MDSIRAISLLANEGQDFDLLLGNFLDEFYLAGPSRQESMLDLPPIDMTKPERVPLLAACAHKLALDHGLYPPKWVFEPRCYLPGSSPYFALGAKGNLRLLFMYKSPSEFKHRNLFVDENVLVRV